MCTYVCVCMYVCMYNIFVCICVFVYVCVYVCMKLMHFGNCFHKLYLRTTLLDVHSIRNRDVSNKVTRIRAEWPRNRGSISDRVNRFSFLHVYIGTGTHRASYLRVNEEPFDWVWSLECKCDQQASSSAEVQNAHSCTWPGRPVSLNTATALRVLLLRVGIESCRDS